MSRVLSTHFLDFFDIASDTTSGLLEKFYESEAPATATIISSTGDLTRKPTIQVTPKPIRRPTSPNPSPTKM